MAVNMQFKTADTRGWTRMDSETLGFAAWHRITGGGAKFPVKNLCQSQCAFAFICVHLRFKCTDTALWVWDERRSLRGDGTRKPQVPH